MKVLEGNSTLIKIRKEMRDTFFQNIPNYWDVNYSLLDAHILHKSEPQKVRQAASRAGRIFLKMAKLLRLVPDDALLALGFPKQALNFLRLNPIEMETVIGRLDLVLYEEKYKVLEFNSDTPTFIKELFSVAGSVCQKLNLKNPNVGEEKKLAKAIRKAISLSTKRLGIVGLPNIVFTAIEESSEDSLTVQYLMKICEIPAKFIPLSKIRIIQGVGLFDDEGNRIHILYRQTYPIEMMLMDEDPINGEKVGESLIELVEMNKLAIINPPSAFLLQSKAVMALIWGLHEQNHSFFTKEEHLWIEEHFLPTYLEADVFIAKGQKYVRKPVFGREGDTVEIYENEKKVMEDPNKSYRDYLAIYQSYVDLPKINIMTGDGPSTGHALVGAFVIDGEASAFGYRVGNQITDNISYFVPAATRS